MEPVGAGAGGAEGAGAGTSPRQSRRGPAPFASFDHDVSDEVRPDSSPESKLAFQLPEIREDASPSTSGGLGVPAAEGRARSASTPAVHALQPTPRIDISRASSSSHQDSRDSSPEMALFAGTGSEATQGRLELGFREDGALELRSSTEELAFLEGAGTSTTPPVQGPARPAPPVPESRRHSRKDSQGSEAALLVVGRTSRLSSVGSQCSALSAYSHQSRVSVGRLSVVSGMSRSPSPHKMLLETSFCGPKPIENDPEVCVAAVEERLMEIAKLSGQLPAALPAAEPPATNAPKPQPTPAPEAPVIAVVTVTDEEKRNKEMKNRARAEDRRARSRERRDDSYDKPEVYRSRNKSKSVIRIKLRPDDGGDDDDDDEEESERPARKPASLELRAEPRPQRDSRTPSPAPGQVSRKSSFCSLFKSRETIASPESPANANIRRKKSLNEGRSRSKSRDRSANRGSVLSLFRTPRRSAAPSPAPSSRAASPPLPASIPPHPEAAGLKYYEDSRDGVIHIPLRTPPEEKPGSSTAPTTAAIERPSTSTSGTSRTVSQTKPLIRTVLPDGSIIIPLHSPTEKISPHVVEAEIVTQPKSPPKEIKQSQKREEPKQASVQKVVEPAPEPEIIELASPPSPAVISSVVTPVDTSPRKRRERLLFTTNVGSREQVFSTQFSITKTPSVTSEISGSFASFPDNGVETVPTTPQLLRDTHIATVEPPPRSSNKHESPASISRELSITPTERRDPSLDYSAQTPTNQRRDMEDIRMDSSGSEPSSETGRRGPLSELLVAEEGEKRGLVLGQESFEDELPYVPTTLPMERSMALPMVPVRERGGVSVARVERPRPCAPTPAGPPRAPHPTSEPRAPTPSEKIKISLPRRPRAASASSAPRSERTRTRSGSAAGKEWIDFEEVPERRKQPKRIQTLPAATAAAPRGADVVYSYVEPEHCHCECHATARRDDEQPLLTDPIEQDTRLSPQSPECSGSHVTMSVHIARPFTADLDLRHDQSGYSAEEGSSRRH